MYTLPTINKSLARDVRNYVWNELARVKPNMYKGGTVILDFMPEKQISQLVVKIPTGEFFTYWGTEKTMQYIEFAVDFDEFSTAKKVAEEVITTAMLLDP